MLALPAADPAPVTHADSPARLVIAAILGIAVIVALVVWCKMHPFLALTLGSAVLAVVAGIVLCLRRRAAVGASASLLAVTPVVLAD